MLRYDIKSVKYDITFYIYVFTSILLLYVGNLLVQPCVTLTVKVNNVKWRDRVVPALSNLWETFFSAFPHKKWSPRIPGLPSAAPPPSRFFFFCPRWTSAFLGLALTFILWTSTLRSKHLFQYASKYECVNATLPGGRYRVSAARQAWCWDGSVARCLVAGPSPISPLGLSFLEPHCPACMRIDSCVGKGKTTVAFFLIGFKSSSLSLRAGKYQIATNFLTIKRF